MLIPSLLHVISICKEMPHLAPAYPCISAVFLKAPVNEGFRYLACSPPALCILLHLSWQKIPSLVWTFAALCLSSSRGLLALFHAFFFSFPFSLCSFS